MALIVIGLIALGFYMANTESYQFYDLHKSFGVIASLFLIARLVWRKFYPWRSSANGTKQARLVRFAHRLILILLLLMPLSGFLISGFGGHGVGVFGLQIIPSNYNDSGLAVRHNEFLTELGYFMHELVAYLLTALLVLHIAAALKHHLIDKDDTLKRMLGTSKN
ncbi:MAG: cytochrome b [Gammaproteobacteria bacterium]|nr:cytochrome b [Gammaproteobacteria bacterium]